MFSKVRLAKGKLAKMFILGGVVTPDNAAVVVNSRIMLAQVPNDRVMG